jgi:hypothetical protein
MAWPFSNNRQTEEPKVPDPEKKVESTPNEKSIAEMIAESLKPVVDGFAAMQQDINSLKQAKVEVKREPAERISVLDDEDAAFNQRMTPLLQSQLEMECRMNTRDIKQEYIDAGFGDLWRQYEGEINKTLEGTALVSPDGQGGFKKLRGDAQYIRNVADMILGRAARTSGVRFDGSKKTFFLEGANANESAGSSNAKETEGLTAKQVKLAQRLGIPIDKMKATVSKLEFHN